MKKNNALLLLLSMVLILATSCKKTYYCECKTAKGVVEVTPITTLGRFGAKDVCDSYQYQNNYNGASQICKLR